jgi:clorobiocin biosynthesis protein CloN5
MPTEELPDQLMDFIRERFLDGDLKGELDESTPLLEWGVLNSMNTAVLLTFVRAELGVPVPASYMNADNFKDVRSLTAMIRSLESTVRA